MKTSELTGAALDLAVAKAWQPVYSDQHLLEHAKDFHPSTDWAQGGPIIEREEIALEPMTHDEHGDGWLATRVEGPAVCMEFGPTMLIAAMRCYVAACLGDEIELPEELK
jgi:Protein of unknown function (DUF2591)